MSRASFAIFLVLVTAAFAQQQGGRGGTGAAAPAGRIPSIEDRTQRYAEAGWFFPALLDEKTGNLWLRFRASMKIFLYAGGLAAGLGSNDIGLDRGQEGGGRVASFQRVGPQIFLVQPNESFRSSSSNPAERKSVEDSFAKSILWGFTVGAESNGHVLIDATPFFVRDGLGAGGSLRPGPYRVDRTRSAVYMARTKAFPKNTEIEVTLTFASEAAGGRGGGAGGPAQGPPQIGVGGAGAAGGRGGGGGFGGGLFSGSVASVTPSADAVTLRETFFAGRIAR